MMGEYLYRTWMDQDVADLQAAILHYGIDGVLQEFEGWLERHRLLIPQSDRTVLLENGARSK